LSSRLPTGIRDGSFFDARRHQASRPAEKGIIHASGGARCTASRSASYQTGDKRGAVEKGPIRVAEFPGSNFAKRFGLALAKPRGPPVRVLLPCCCRRFPCKGYKNSRFQRLGNLELGCGNVRLILAGGRQREQAFNRIPRKISYSRELGAETGSRLTASSATAERTYQPERRVRRCAPQNPLGFLLYLWPGDSASGSMRREQ
jgi:hypothetical protein